MGNYGDVKFKGEVYEVTCEAWVDNIGTDGDVAYYAHAEKDGKEYKVMWHTTKEYDKSCMLLGLEQELENVKKQGWDDGTEERIKEIEEQIKELEDEGVDSFYCEDGSNACNWDEADDVWEIDEFGMKAD